MIKAAQYIADFLVENGIEDMFMITGGGAMHLDDAFGHKKGLHCIFNHHEQACAMAAEGYTRLTGKLAAVCVTSGPGGTNAITGVLGGWLDSIPMLIISGQVKRETTTWITDVPLRQLGDQEYNIVASVKPMCKYAHMITDAREIRYHLEKALYLATNGRGGPVWLDIPLDIQAAQIDVDVLEGFDPFEEETKEIPVYRESKTKRILKHISEAKRPVVFAGSGVRLSGGYEDFLRAVDKLKVPVVTAWNAHDVLWNDHPLYCGRPGTVGTRGGNFVVQNSDLLLVLGCRLNIRQISYNYKEFAPDAFKIIVDIDKFELLKPTVKPDIPIWADCKDVMRSIADSDYKSVPEHAAWLRWSRAIDAKYPAVLPTYFKKKSPINPYVFIDELFDQLIEGDTVVTGNGSACVVSFQAAKLKKEQRLFTNSGCAAMGYGFPAAIGTAVARKGQRVICLDGDGSFQMNLQELQTVVYNKLNLKIFYLNNNGYHSIRQTQNNLFKPPLIGVCDGNGISFPDIEKIAWAYGIPFVRAGKLSTLQTDIHEALSMTGAVICEVILDPEQNFAPKLSSKVLSDGKIVSPPIDDMFPFLDKSEYAANKAMKGL